jgi:sensor domain CHASE-containing protein
MGQVPEIQIKDRVAWVTVAITVLMIVISWVTQQAVTASQISDLKSLFKDMQTQQQKQADIENSHYNDLSNKITAVSTRQADMSNQDQNQEGQQGAKK